ncbi:MAG: AIM24 family protein [Desulfotomaculales bacterium]
MRPVCRTDILLCATRGIDIACTRRCGAGLFGSEGFILQRPRGDGLAFVHAGETMLDK